jgi:hypothetical protein
LSLKILTRLCPDYIGADEIELGELTLKEIRELQELFRNGVQFFCSSENVKTPVFMQPVSVEIGVDEGDSSNMLLCEFILQ